MRRVAVLPAPPGGTCDPLVSQAVRRAADALADALGHQETLGMDRQQLGVEHGLALGQQVPEDVQQTVAVVAGLGADRHDLLEEAALGVLVDQGQELGSVL